MVALILVMLPLPAERIGDSTPVVVRQLRLAAGVGLLLLPLDHEAAMLIEVRGMKQGTLLVPGITPEQILKIAHDTSIFGGSPLSGSVSLVPKNMAPGPSSSKTIGVHVLVAFLFGRQL